MSGQLAEGRTLREVLETSRRVFKPADTFLERQAAYLETLVVLKNIPGPWLKGERADEIRRTAQQVVRGVAA